MAYLRASSGKSGGGGQVFNSTIYPTANDQHFDITDENGNKFQPDYVIIDFYTYEYSYTKDANTTYVASKTAWGSGKYSGTYPGCIAPDSTGFTFVAMTGSEYGNPAQVFAYKEA